MTGVGDRPAGARETGGKADRPRPRPHSPPREGLRSGLTLHPVPFRGLAISVLALAVAVVVGLAWPESVRGNTGLVSILALVPLFLLCRFRGWQGAAVAAGSAMVVFTGAEIVVVELMGRSIDWRLYGMAIVLLATVVVGGGRVTELLQRERREAMRMAYEDPLTLLPSRQALDFHLSTQVAAARRGRALSLVVFDLDGFRRYNDRHGRAAGDQFLYRIGAVLSDNTREMNLVGRYGGEEFLAVLPGEDAEGARVYAERVRKAVSELEPADEAPTISAGVSSFGEGVEDASDLLARADRALHGAKARGGDRVSVYDGGREAP